ncbi:hypothetical protein T484DRAFT_3647853, partial [Baffinella frigidus]
MAAKSLEVVGPKLEKVIKKLTTSHFNITQSATGAAIHANDAQELTTPPEDAWEEKTQTGSKLIPANPMVLFSVGFLPILDDIIIQLTTLTELANEYSRRNSEANTDVDTLETTKLRLEFLSLAQQHVMCWKAISDTDTSGISFSSNNDNMIKFRAKFLKLGQEDMVAAENAEKVANGQAITYKGEDVNKKTFDTTLEKLTKSTKRLKLSPYYQYAKPEDPLDTHRLEIMTNTITTVEEIVEAMGQVSFTPIEEAYTPTTQVKTAFLTNLLAFYYCADGPDEFPYAVQTSARLVTTTAITGKGEAGDKKMKEYFYDFIKALFGATEAQALKTELDKEAQKKEHTGMFVRTVKEYYTIKVPERKVAEQLIWSKEVRQTAADLFTRQKTVGVPKPALEDATQQKPFQPTCPTTPGKHETNPRPKSGRVTTGGSSKRNLTPIPG